jgi:hypothetical protein
LVVFLEFLFDEIYHGIGFSIFIFDDVIADEVL